MSASRLRIDRIEGTGLPLRGQDIDTDRIIPARFLRSVTFEGLEDHLFEDDRRGVDAAGRTHPFSNAAYRGAAVLLVNRNFGCGSSREHAPQALVRWGIRAVVGESFSEIFFGNSMVLGLPCLKVPPADVLALMDEIEADPARRLDVSVASLTIRSGDRLVRATMPDAARSALVDGLWDATALLLENDDEVRAVARRLPYLGGFAA